MSEAAVIRYVFVYDLKRAEDFSRRNHMKRSELFSLGLQKVLAEGAPGTRRKTA